MQSFSKTNGWAAPRARLVPFSPSPPNVKLCGQWAKGSAPVPDSEAWAPHALPPKMWNSHWCVLSADRKSVV